MDTIREEYEFSNFFARFLFDQESGVCAIILSGSMDTYPIVKLQDETGEIIKQRKYDFIVDLSHATSISSKGLGFLVFLSKYRKNFVYLSYPPENIVKPFKLLDFEDLFKYYHSIDELNEEKSIPESLILLIKQEIVLIRDIHYHKLWLKILRDYLETEDESSEIQKMTPYLQLADSAQSISVPSQEKYACILFRFLNRIFRKVAMIERTEVDDTIVELVSKELMTNAVLHGYNGRKDGIIEANYNLEDESIEINVIDYGKGFSPSDHPKDIYESTGLHLLKKIFDTVTISEAPKKKVPGVILGPGTMVKMVKNIR
jgi:anti-anti-sigma factor